MRALMVTGLPARTGLMRALALVELVVGGLSLVGPSPLLAGVVAVLYAGFCSVSLVLARRHAACGCFGDSDAPASGVQSALSAALCLVAIGAAIAPAHGIGWIIDAGAAQASALVIGIAGAAYATIAAYTELPQAFAAWSGQ